MSKIKFSGLGVTDMSGKIGGNVAAKNRFGNYLRRKGQTINPQTEQQQLARMAFGALSQIWRALTDVQRAAWNALTSFVSVTDMFGDSIRLTGAQLYNKFNTNLRIIGQAANDDAPVLEGAAEVTGFTAAFDVGAGATEALAIDIDFSNGTPHGNNVVLEATPPLSAGRAEGSVKNLYRGLNSVAVNAAITQAAANTDGTISIAEATLVGPVVAQYVAIFGIPTVGQKIFFRMSFVNSFTGERSPNIIVSTTVISTP